MKICVASFSVQEKWDNEFIGSGAKHSLQRFPEEFRQQFTLVKLSNVAVTIVKPKNNSKSSLKVTGSGDVDSHRS